MSYYGGQGGRGGYSQQRQQREQRDNDGVLFLNNKRTSDKAPTFRGSATIAGRSYWISAWEKQDKNGDPMFSMAFEPKDEGVRQTPERPPERRGGYGQRREDYQRPPRDNVPPPNGPEDYGARREDEPPPFNDEIDF